MAAPATENLALTEDDRKLLAQVEPALSRARALKTWWELRDPSDGYEERFQLIRAFNPADNALGFFDETVVDGVKMPLMGAVQEMTFDQPKGGKPVKMRDQIREFVMRYFLRASDFRKPAAFTDSGFLGPLPLLRDTVAMGDDESDRAGFGFAQRYYKPAGASEPAKFSEAERHAIVDLRDIGRKYDWIVLQVRIFDFSLVFRLLGNQAPQVLVPLREETYVVLHKDFLVAEDDPEPGTLGRYYVGYALLKDPLARGPFAYGPGHFEAGFQAFQFEVDGRGHSSVRMPFVVNRPEQILKLVPDPTAVFLRAADFFSLGMFSKLMPAAPSGFDPVTTSISLANIATLGTAGRFGISREALERDMLVQHFMQHYTMISGALLTYRSVADWTDPATIPEWVESGELA